MIRFTTGDILAEDAEALVNTVNCVGVMGRGIALQFKKAFPDNFRVYADACARGEVQPGRMFVFETGALTNPRYIINFPTKRHWRGNSRIEDIQAGLKDLATVIRARDIRSIAVPPLGSGLGGLEWSDVRPRIEKALHGFNDLDVVVFEPRGAPAAERMVQSQDVPKMTAGRAALVGLMDRYLNGLLDPFVTLLEVHKLMYFMHAAGQRLKLRYTKGPYGPLRREPAARPQRGGGALHIGIRRRRRQARQAAGDRPRRRRGRRQGAASLTQDPRALRQSDGPRRRVRIGLRPRAALHGALGHRARHAHFV